MLKIIEYRAWLLGCVLFFYCKIEKVIRSNEILWQRAENKKKGSFAPERSVISSISSKGSTVVW